MGRKQEESHVKSTAEQEQHLTYGHAYAFIHALWGFVLSQMYYMHKCAVEKKMHISLFLYLLRKLQKYLLCLIHIPVQ